MDLARSLRPSRGPSRTSRWGRFARQGGIQAIGFAVFGVVLVIASGAAAHTVTGTAHAPQGAYHRLAYSAGDDWPTFMGSVQRTGANLGESVLSNSTAPSLGLAWTYATGGPIEGPATVVNGTLYIGSWDGDEYALNASTGALLWKHFLGQVTNPNCNWMSPIGVTSGATVVGNRLYVAGGGSTFFALNASTGHALWSLYAGPNGTSGTYLWASPLVDNGSVYIGVASQCDNPLVQGKLLQVYASNGTIRHVFYAVGSGTTFETGGSIWSTPALDPSSNTIWVTTGNEDTGSTYARCVVALNASTLAVIGSWQQPIPGYDYDFGAGATVAGRGSGSAWVVATNKDGYTYAFNRTNVSASGSWGPIWADQTTSFHPYLHPPADAISPAAWDGRWLYIGGGNTSIGGIVYPGSVRAIHPSNGTYAWEHGASGVVRGGVAYADGLVVDAAVSKTIANHTVLEVLNAIDGRTLWSTNVTGTVNSNPTIAEGHIYIGTGSTDITAWNTVPGGEPGYVEAFAPGATRSLYHVNFTETGLPTGTNWSVTLDGATNRSSTGTIGFLKPNGTAYAFTIGRLAGYVPYPSAGRLNVSGAGVTQSIRFTPATLPLWFNETGLPAGTLWSVTVDGSGSFSGSVSNGSTTASIGFRVPPNFTGVYSVSPPGGYSPTPSGGPVSVPASGSPVTIPISFASGFPPTFPLWFNATGLLSGASWQVKLSGKGPAGTLENLTSSSMTSSIGFWVPAGTTWAFTIGAPEGQLAVPASGNLTTPEPGGPFNESIALVPLPPTIVGFSVNPSSIFLGGRSVFEVIVSGGEVPLAYVYGHLPTGCASVDTSNVTCAPSQAGTYRVSVVVTDALDRSAGGNVTLTVLTPPTGPVHTQPIVQPTLWGLPLTTGYVLFGGLAAAIAVGIAILLARRRRPPKEPAIAPSPVPEP